MFETKLIAGIICWMETYERMKKSIRNKKKWASRCRGTFAILAILCIWEGLGHTSVLNENVLPRPTVVIRTLVTDIRGGELLGDAWQSIRRVIIGYLIAVAIAVPLGIASALYSSFGDFLRPVVELLRPIPPVAWIPIALLWFGFGEAPAYFLVGLGAFFPAFSNAFLGITLVERGPVEVGKCHGASKWLMFTKIILPQALPSIFTGLQTGLGVAWIVVITAELVGAQSGLGYMIQISRAQLDSERVVAGMIMIAITGYCLNLGMNLIGKWLMPWKQRGRHLLVNE